MITTKIEVPQHLKEYLIGKFCNLQDSPIRFPDKTDIYHFIYDLLERRPANIFKDHGNLTIDEKRKKEAITAQKHDRASVVNCPFFDQKMF